MDEPEIVGAEEHGQETSPEPEPESGRTSPQPLPEAPATERAQAVVVGQLQAQVQSLHEQLVECLARLDAVDGRVEMLQSRVQTLVREELETVLSEALEDNRIDAHEATRLSALQRMMIG